MISVVVVPDADDGVISQFPRVLQHLSEGIGAHHAWFWTMRQPSNVNAVVVSAGSTSRAS